MRLRTLPTLLLACLLMLVPALSAAPALAQPEPAPAEDESIYASPELDDGSPAPQPAAESWIVGDLDSGEVFSAEGPSRELAPASVIKLLTALALVDVLEDPEQKYEAVSEDMLVDGTKVGIVQENEYSVDALFHAMLMSSANDAAHGLGNAAGGQDQAVQLMNDKAAELGLTGTVARNTSGLDAPGQVTTVADLMIIAHAVIQNDYLMDILATPNYTFPGAANPDTEGTADSYEIGNHTKVAGSVPGGLGLKNGYTQAAKGSFVAVVERDDRTYVSALLNSENNTRQAAIDLVEWADNQAEPEVVDTIEVTPPPEPQSPPVTTGAAGDLAAQPPETSTDSGSLVPFTLLLAAAAVLLCGIVTWAVVRRRGAHFTVWR